MTNTGSARLPPYPGSVVRGWPVPPCVYRPVARIRIVGAWQPTVTPVAAPCAVATIEATGQAGCTQASRPQRRHVISDGRKHARVHTSYARDRAYHARRVGIGDTAIVPYCMHYGTLQPRPYGRVIQRRLIGRHRAATHCPVEYRQAVYSKTH